MAVPQLPVELDLAVAGSVQVEEPALAALALEPALGAYSAIKPAEVLAVRLAPLAALVQAVDLVPGLQLELDSEGRDLLFSSRFPRVTALAAPRSTQ